MVKISRMAAGAAMTALLAAASLLLGGTGLTGVAAARNGGSVGDTPPGQYCTDNGGVVETRQAAYNTNGGPILRLAGIRSFCRWTSASDGSRIYVSLDALYTTYPSLAALAYYSQTQPGSCTGNPASCYCSLLGGSDLFGGINAAGGGWIKNNSVDRVLEACIFPDDSSIDSFGLFYHSAGIVRGIDLDGILRYPNPYKKKH
jgi:hypothetical protein